MILGSRPSSVLSARCTDCRCAPDVYPPSHMATSTENIIIASGTTAPLAMPICVCESTHPAFNQAHFIDTACDSIKLSQTGLTPSTVTKTLLMVTIESVLHRRVITATLPLPLPLPYRPNRTHILPCVASRCPLRASRPAQRLSGPPLPRCIMPALVDLPSSPMRHLTRRTLDCACGMSTTMGNCLGTYTMHAMWFGWLHATQITRREFLLRWVRNARGGADISVFGDLTALRALAGGFTLSDNCVQN